MRDKVSGAIAIPRQGCGISPACLGIAIAPETLSLITTSLFLRQLRFAVLSLIFVSSHYTISFASQTWAARPHLGSIFVKLLHQKTFGCLWLVF